MTLKQLKRSEFKVEILETNKNVVTFKSDKNGKLIICVSKAMLKHLENQDVDVYIQFDESGKPQKMFLKPRARYVT